MKLRNICAVGLTLLFGTHAVLAFDPVYDEYSTRSDERELTERDLELLVSRLEARGVVLDYADSVALASRTPDPYPEPFFGALLSIGARLGSKLIKKKATGGGAKKAVRAAKGGHKANEQREQHKQRKNNKGKRSFDDEAEDLALRSLDVFEEEAAVFARGLVDFMEGMQDMSERGFGNDELEDVLERAVSEFEELD